MNIYRVMTVRAEERQKLEANKDYIPVEVECGRFVCDTEHEAFDTLNQFIVDGIYPDDAQLTT
jgi:hypothetical protein